MSLQSKTVKLKTSLPADVLVPVLREVQRYLKEHPDMSSVVQALCRSARDEFGEQAELTLEVYDDPEVEDRYLILYVRLPACQTGTRERLDTVWEHFETQLCDLSGWIILATDFRG